MSPPPTAVAKKRPMVGDMARLIERAAGWLQSISVMRPIKFPEGSTAPLGGKARRRVQGPHNICWYGPPLS
jgi:hypothetical protein